LPIRNLTFFISIPDQADPAGQGHHADRLARTLRDSLRTAVHPEYEKTFDI
jgi:hypothetical protein